MSTENKKFLNMIFLGEVASVQHYGAFIKIPGSRNQGLVHRSQISSSKVDDASDVLQCGDRVWCKVINIANDGKISLSMKVVDQGGGKDLDPNGVQIHQDQQKQRERPTNSGRKKIELGAVLNTTCTKCGTRGHLSKDCFKDPGGKTYELLSEEDEQDIAVDNEKLKNDINVMKKKKKDQKKIKKEKNRKRKKSHRSSSSSSESYEIDKKKKKIKKKKEIKKKKVKTDEKQTTKILNHPQY